MPYRSDARAESAPAGPVLLVVGDSLSAEYGLARGAGWVEQLRQRIPGTVNASISGDTTSGGLARLPGLLERHRPALTVLELGGNDALRGLPLTQTRGNLERMIDLVRQSGSKVVLVAMRVPPNYGPGYSRDFARLYDEMASRHGLASAPFLLDGFETDLSQFQPDRIHPTASAQARMLENVWPVIESTWQQAGAKAGGKADGKTDDKGR